MSTLPTELRNKLERTCVAARNLAERAATDALKSLAVAHHEPYGHMTPAQRSLRNKLWARAKQLGDTADAKGQRSIDHLAQECAYEQWHRMLFARFLAENNLLIEPEMDVAVSLEEVKELAKDAETNLWALAGRFAQTMLPEIFRADDPVLQVPLAREDQLKLEALLDVLATDTFTASDSLGWCYQFWQAERKDQVNAAGNKIGAEELPSVTQLFTEDYMVDFLLDNTLGAWWAGKKLTAENAKNTEFKTEEDVRRFCALPGCPWKYLRFVKEEKNQGIHGAHGKPETDDSSPSVSSVCSVVWKPAAGRFEGWPKTAKELKCLDPCCGSGHFIVGMFERVVALRMAEEKLGETAAVQAAIRENIFGLELDPRCTQIGAFSLALAAWRRVGHCALPAMHIACSGLAPNTREADWLKLAGDSDKLQRGMARLYRLFKDAPVLGSLINPHADGDLLEAGFQELRPLLGKALMAEKTSGYLREGVENPTDLEVAVTAQGIAKAAEILAGQFTLVATNVPYLGRGKQNEELTKYCERVYPEAKADLATCFVERSLIFCAHGGSIALVTPQNWLFLGTYKKLRQRLLEGIQWDSVARLGEHAFDSSQAAGAFVALFGLTNRMQKTRTHKFAGFDAADQTAPYAKAKQLLEGSFRRIEQHEQLKNPDARIVIGETVRGNLLNEYADSYWGLGTGDFPRFGRSFWELGKLTQAWSPVQSTIDEPCDFGGSELVVFWEQGRGTLMRLAEELRQIEGNSGIRPTRGAEAWGKRGICVSLMRELLVTRYEGHIFDGNCAAVIPKNLVHLPAIWAFCSSPEFSPAVRAIDQKVNVTNHTLLKIPFDLAHWQKVAAEKYPHGLPKPFSSDPTQWLFNGHPKQQAGPEVQTTEHTEDTEKKGKPSLSPSVCSVYSVVHSTSLQVAVARLVGYQWPRQTGSSFPDCPALGPDGLEKLADDDGIVCLPSVRGESPAAERVRQLLQAAYGADWKAHTELELIRASGSDAADLEEWLRNDFFEQHCDIFQQRPFVWHIWDESRKRDGFHALVNYHTLAGDKGKGRRTLESLTHSYLGDWIMRQKDGLKRGEEGADERLVAALALKEKLEAIIEGNPPFDIFVRWKALACQPMGWNPDINDGVRMNIRPFMASEIAGGKRGAGVLRIKPNIKWDKDRGKEPKRDKAEYPWFYDGSTFTGDRVNDVHLTKEQKEEGASRTGHPK